MTSVASLDLVDEFVLHGVSGFVGSWTWHFDVLIEDGGTSDFLLYWGLFLGFGLFSKLETDIVSARTNNVGCDRFFGVLEPFASSKTTNYLSSFTLCYFRLF